MAPKPPLDSLLIRRQARKLEWENRRITPRRVTPSSLTGGRVEGGVPYAGTGRDSDVARLTGVCAHAVLEQWDFARPCSEIGIVIEKTIDRYLGQNDLRMRADMTEDLAVLFDRFLSSEPYGRLQRATVLGREVPFVMSIGEFQLMEGVMDLIYRLDDRIWIADYKTDDVVAEDVQTRIDRYRPQADMYLQAVGRSLGLSSLSFQFIFLRLGLAMDV